MRTEAEIRACVERYKNMAHDNVFRAHGKANLSERAFLYDCARECKRVRDALLWVLGEVEDTVYFAP